MRKEQLKRKLEYHYKAFDRNKISPDPIEFPKRFKNFFDIEISAFLSSVFAYGNIKQIQSSLEKLHNALGESPYEFILNFKPGIKTGIQFKHRFYTAEDIETLLKILQKVYLNYGSLKYLFLLYYFPKDKNLKNSISFFSNNLLGLIKNKPLSNGLRFMFPDPLRGSACKRMNLFLRWMVRKDNIDFGLWNEIPASQLVIPVDTHIARISRSLKLTNRKVVSWKMAEEITENLKKFDESDPVKYDFSLCHIGIRNMKF